MFKTQLRDWSTVPFFLSLIGFWPVLCPILQCCAYPVVKEDHQKAEADEDYQRHKQKSSHHGEVILSKTQTKKVKKKYFKNSCGVT